MSSPEEVKDTGVLSDTPNDSGEDSPGTQSSPAESLKQNGETSPRPIHGFKWALVCASLYIGALIYGLDTTIAADIQSAIVERFNNVERLTWVGTAFPLGSVCAVLPTSALYATFDLKPLFIGSILLFEIGSALCGAAPSMDSLIVGRVIAGLGGSGIFLGYVHLLETYLTDRY